MAKGKILLVTAGFPFGDWERGFLGVEFQHLYRQYYVYILCVGCKEPMIHPHPESVPVERYFHKISARKPAGCLRLVKALLRRDTLGEMGAAARGVSLGKALRRWKQILFFRAKADAAAAHMERLHQAHHFDMIYTYWCTEMTLGAAALKDKYPDLKVITRFHGHDLFRDRRDTGWQPFRPVMAQKADRLVFACQMGLDYFLDTWGSRWKEKSLLFYLGSPDTPMPPKAPSGCLRLVSCSNLIPLKRVERIIDGISLLPGSIPIRWDHFGDGSEQEALERRAAEKLGSHVAWQFHGRVPNHTLPEHYRALDPDLFLTTTSSEGGVPVSIQEAFCMGIPAIGTAVGGVPELIVPGQTGFLLHPEGDGAALADAIGAYLSMTPEAQSRLRANARKLWETKFDAERNAHAFLAALEALLAT